MPFVKETAMRIELSEFWSYSDDRKTAEYREILTEPIEILIDTRYVDDIWTLRNAALWRRCNAKGARVASMANHIGGDENALRRSLKAGKASEKKLWVAVKDAGLHPQDEMTPPNAYEELVAYTRAVPALWHYCHTRDIRLLSDAARKPVSRFSLAQGALLFKLFRDDNVLNKWIHLATSVALVESAHLANPTIRSFLASLFRDAGHMLLPNTDAVDDLGRSCPQQSELATSLALIAEAWNPYQLFWYFTREAVNSM
jgi:hypothetical protein